MKITSALTSKESEEAMFTVQPFGSKFSLIWGGNASMFFVEKGEAKTWASRQEAQSAADLLNDKYA